jgi:hypothetical protein
VGEGDAYRRGIQQGLSLLGALGSSQEFIGAERSASAPQFAPLGSRVIAATAAQGCALGFGGCDGSPSLDHRQL